MDVITVGLGISSPIEARQDSPVRRKVYKGREQSQRQSLLLLLENQHVCHICIGGLDLS